MSLFVVVKTKKSSQKCKRELLMFKSTLAGLQDDKGRRTEDRTEMEEICRKFYTNLFASKMDVKAPQIAKGDTEHLPVLISEARTTAF